MQTNTPLVVTQVLTPARPWDTIHACVPCGSRTYGRKRTAPRLSVCAAVLGQGPRTQEGLQGCNCMERLATNDGATAASSIDRHACRSATGPPWSRDHHDFSRRPACARTQAQQSRTPARRQGRTVLRFPLVIDDSPVVGFLGSRSSNPNTQALHQLLYAGVRCWFRLQLESALSHGMDGIQ